LNSRIYLGDTVHRGHSYPGQHEAIVPGELWDQVAARLQANNQARRTGKSHLTESLLSGIVFDANGIRFTPTHAVKKGKRYRYYTSQAVIRERGDLRQLARYPAEALETLVTTQIHEFLKISDKYLHEAEASPHTELAAQRAKDLAAQWPKLGIAKQQEFIRGVVKSVILGDKNLWIELDKLKVTAMLLDQSPDEIPAPGNQKVVMIKLKVAFQSVRRGGELRIYAPDGQPTQKRPIPSLMKAIARARTWYEQLVTGEVSGVAPLARQSGFKCRYVRKILQSAVLSRDIVEAILSGSQADHVTVKSLQADLPLDWGEQGRMFLSGPSV
jgi:site-specific DNA recombinase